ncbi:MAG TPA: 4Fe-4S binding protein [Candidatus Faeciplasma pullistercoris]|uniref:4Fe-4S binding protein n=1 Tax=Candidatus Faeciplasma pullistercoris TaxID=2840800 RepID=A0A9D1GT92_9FIRM|nr:4Fe-4S binding protein [Candidatus Faeciplasma pullistercoris]
MKRVYVNEKWCLGCHLCEYNCAFANSGCDDMVKALKGKDIYPRIKVEGDDKITYAVSCRHCTDPICVRSCISGALSKSEDGMVSIDKNKCIGCLTCVLVCPYGAISQDETGAVQKCELCLRNSSGEPACVKGCPNRAIVYEER